MNPISLQNQKLTYLIGIIILLIPIVYLGIPGTGGKSNTNGILPSLRTKYELGESDIGSLDPTSSAMNMVLFGFRGIAVNQLWQQADKLKDEKEWDQLKAVTDSIVRLQPHFIEVWRFNAWNLTYNVSAEWDDVAERFWWVKAGSKFLKKGIAINAKDPNLPHTEGNHCGFKIGQSDESRFFRKYFKVDPDTEQYKGGPDPEMNPDGLDNYLVARSWYQIANERERTTPETITDQTLFRSYPARCLFDFANALQRDGLFGEQTRVAWDEAYTEWTKVFGQEHFRLWKEGLGKYEMWLEMSPEDVVSQTGDDAEGEQRLRKAVDDYQKITNFRYWRERALCEREPVMADAHRELYEAKEAYADQRLDDAQKLVESGMKSFAEMQKKYPELLSTDDLLIEEAMTAVLMWRLTLNLSGQPIPDDYPLKAMWDTEQGRLHDVQERFDRSLLERARDRRNKI